MCGTNKKDRCGVYPSLYLPLPRKPLETPVHHQALQQRVEELKAENAQLQSALASQSEVAEVCTGPTMTAGLCRAAYGTVRWDLGLHRVASGWHRTCVWRWERV